MLAVVSVLVVFMVIAWLKGAFGLVALTYRKFAHEGGDQRTLTVLSEPFLALFVVFVVGAFGIAHPASAWARWFYGDKRMLRARKRYTEDGTAMPTMPPG